MQASRGRFFFRENVRSARRCSHPPAAPRTDEAADTREAADRENGGHRRIRALKDSP